MSSIIYIVLGIAISLILAILVFKVCKTPDTAKGLVGESGIVLADISIDKNGVIKLNGKEYIAAAEDGGEIPKNCKATVTKVTDEKLYVERVKF